MKTVLITGGSGLVGSSLTKLLVTKGYKVIWLSTHSNIKGDIHRYKWDYRYGIIDKEAVGRADYIIHLSGASIGNKWWTESRKKEIVDSRVKTAKLILHALQEIGKQPEAFISASAVGYYGLDISDKIYAEDDVLRGADFLSDTCRKWEKASSRFDDVLGVRTVILRTGVVISSKSDAFKKMMMPVKWGLGSPLGKGTQYLSWIHIDDLCNMYLKAIEDVEMRGVYNAVAPDYVTNAEFMHKLSTAMDKPFFMPRIPSFAIRMAMGESADLVLGGSRVSAQKIEQAGFEFKYAHLDDAIEATLMGTDTE